MNLLIKQYLFWASVFFQLARAKNKPNQKLNFGLFAHNFAHMLVKFQRKIFYGKKYYDHNLPEFKKFSSLILEGFQLRFPTRIFEFLWQSSIYDTFLYIVH